MLRVSLVLCLAIAIFAAPASGQVSFTDTYMGHNDEDFVGDSCSLASPVVGAEPDVAGKYPVLIWVTATGAEGDWTGSTLTKPRDQTLAKAAVLNAAGNGFVAAYGQYRGRQTSGNDGGIDLQTKCMFNRPNPPRSLLDAVCERPKADCTRIVVAGHSQGGMIAMRAANHNAMVKAAYATSVFGGWFVNKTYWSSTARGGSRLLPDTKLRIATGNEDLNSGWSWLWTQSSGDYSGLRAFTGMTCPDRTVSCMRADGSGWQVVQNAAPPAGPTDKVADHCFMNVDGTNCVDVMPVDPYWLTGDAPWTFKTALQFLKAQV